MVTISAQSQRLSDSAHIFPEFITKNCLGNSGRRSVAGRLRPRKQRHNQHDRFDLHLFRQGDYFGECCKARLPAYVASPYFFLYNRILQRISEASGTVSVNIASRGARADGSLAHELDRS
jgi:hypothetical protein